MKQLQLIFGLIFYLFFSMEEAYCLPRTSCFEVSAPINPGAFAINIGTFYLGTKLSDAAFAITPNGASVNNKTIDSLPPAYDYGGYEVGVKYNFSCSATDLSVTYTHFGQISDDTKLAGLSLESAVSTVPTIIQLADTLHVMVAGVPVTIMTTGNLFDPTKVDFIKGQIDVRQNLVDVELGQNIRVTPDFRIRFSGGIRAAALDNKFNNIISLQSQSNRTATLRGDSITEIIQFTNVDLHFGELVNKKSQFRGLGPRLGIDANYYLAVGVSLCGSLSSALIVGGINSSTSESSRFLFNGLVNAIELEGTVPGLTYTPSLAVGSVVTTDVKKDTETTNPHAVRVVPNVEGRLGINYCYAIPCSRSRIILETGYLINHYWNAADFLSNTNSNTPTLYETQAVNYDGVYFEFKWVV